MWHSKWFGTKTLFPPLFALPYCQRIWKQWCMYDLLEKWKYTENGFLFSWIVFLWYETRRLRFSSYLRWPMPLKSRAVHELMGLYPGRRHDHRSYWNWWPLKMTAAAQTKRSLWFLPRWLSLRLNSRRNCCCSCHVESQCRWPNRFYSAQHSLNRMSCIQCPMTNPLHRLWCDFYFSTLSHVVSDTIRSMLQQTSTRRQWW